jgi:hypothetical protein
VHIHIHVHVVVVVVVVTHDRALPYLNLAPLLGATDARIRPGLGSGEASTVGLTSLSSQACFQ